MRGIIPRVDLGIAGALRRELRRSLLLQRDRLRLQDRSPGR